MGSAGEKKFIEIAELGAGGMGEVQLAVAPGPAGFNKLLVVKKLRTNLAQDDQFLRMFLDEAKLAARFSHANIVQTYDVGFDGDRYYISMEYLDGQTLHAVCRRANERNERFPMVLHLHALCQAFAGLHYAHEFVDFDGSFLNFVHRDFTPHNIFITYDGQVKVVDFGIAKASVSSAPQTATGSFKGKIPYMAPEQIVGSNVDRRSDVFSAGIMLWEAAIQTRPWFGKSDVQIMHALASNAIPKPRDVDPTLDPTLAAIIEKAMSPLASERHGTMQELIADVERYIETSLSGGGSRRLAEFVSGAFTDTRQSIRGVIEKQLHRLRSSENTSISLASLYRTSTSDETSNSNSRDVVLSLSGITPIGAVPSSRWRASPLLGAVLVGSVLAVAGMLFYAGKRSASAKTAAAVETAWSDVRIEGLPMGASIVVDGKALASNPYVDRVVRDGKKHVVQVLKPGYESASVDLAYDKPSVESSVQLSAIAGATTPSGDAGVSPPSKVPVSVPQVTPAILQRAPRDDGRRRPGPAAHGAPRNDEGRAPGADEPRGPAAAPATNPCASPYYLDERGVKKYKPECL